MVLRPEKIRRVVVRGVNWVGDAVMTVPALRELRRILPGAHITLATRAWAAGLFADADFLDEILPHQPHPNVARSVIQQARAWRVRRFDLALLLTNSFATALVACAARVPARVGYATDGRRWLLNQPVARPVWAKERHEIFYYLNLVAELEQRLYGRDTIAQQEPRYQLSVPAPRQQQARKNLTHHSSLITHHSLIFFCPGSTNSRAKRWPVASYAQLGDMLAEKTGAQIVLIGAKDEQDVSQAVAARMSQPVINLSGHTTLAESVALLSQATALVTNDTGPAHIAAALGRPTFVIFGPTNPTTTRPYGPTVQIIREPPACAPCMLRDCPIDHRCMTAVTPEQVFQKMMNDESEGLSGE